MKEYLEELEGMLVDYRKLAGSVSDISEGLKAVWTGEASEVLYRHAQDINDDMAKVYEDIKAWIAESGYM